MSVVRFLTKSVPYIPNSRRFISRHRAFVFIMAATLLVVTTTALLTTKHFVTSNTSSAANDSELSPGSSTSSSTPGVHASQQITNIVSPSGGSMSTNIQVNGKQIKVPENGSMHKTIYSDDGSKTDINVSTSGNATNSNIYTSSSNVQVTTNPEDLQAGSGN